MNAQPVIDATRRWIADMVIGLNLCPFARRVFDAELIRYVVSPATSEQELLDHLAAELTALVTAPRSEVETTLLIHPHALAEFLDYNDFLFDADDLVDDMRLRGVVQVASFHPHYQFAGTDPDAVENYTNRSPHPMLHLLREDGITEVAANPDFLAGIPERNVEMLRRLGLAEVLAKLGRASG
jgi:hypothetical protein